MSNEASADQPVRRVDEDGVITVTFTRDDKLNAISKAMWAVLIQAAHDLADDDAHRVLVITGEGRFFTSGLDIADMKADVGVGTDGVLRGSSTRHQYRAEAYHDFYDFLEQIEKPIVVAAQGSCYGVGIEMAASCDFRLASDAAKFALPEVANLSAIPGSGGISRLTRLIGPHWAKWLVMAGERITAEEALHIGLVHAVYPAEEFEERVQAFAHKLAGTPREALGLAKLAIDASVTADRRTARDIDRLAQTLLFSDPEFHARRRAFLGE